MCTHMCKTLRGQAGWGGSWDLAPVDPPVGDGICLVLRSPHMPSDSSALPVPWGGGSGSVFAFPGGLT